MKERKKIESLSNLTNIVGTLLILTAYTVNLSFKKLEALAMDVNEGVSNHTA